MYATCNKLNCIVCIPTEMFLSDEIRAEMKHMKIAEQVLAPVSKHFKDNPVSRRP